ncbi:unnamed protein product [Nippostrongylus brasiliensis]|uniref:Serine beta-lactamase-like protein LACTB, mitochondrial (inferred by orthology to a human protein) n=1 Tax=Nippostrongylus brasiliensis TaxID=27835 RepID=A0A0N4Y637_NIPBR|nr:unnamed protein product [Nippostrongylus brasiliensis]
MECLLIAWDRSFEHAGVSSASTTVEEKELEEVTPHSDAEEKEFLLNEPYATVTDALKMFQDDDLIAMPGTKFKYTTHGFTLVSAVLEKASGKKFKTLVEDLTFQLGGFSYYKRNKKHVLENCQEVDVSYKWAAGGLLSNVTDLLIFANAILYSYQADPNAKNAFLKKEVIQQFWKGEISVDKKTLAGLGWMRIDGFDYHGTDKSSSLGGLWYHTGGAVGASSVLLIRPNSSESSPPSGVCVAMLCNLQDTSLLSLAKEIEEMFRD